MGSLINEYQILKIYNPFLIIEINNTGHAL